MAHKEQYTVSLTANEWSDLFEILREHDKSLGEIVEEQVGEQMFEQIRTLVTTRLTDMLNGEM